MTSSEPPRALVEAAAGPWGGPTYSYRGARIECLKGAHVCGLYMPGHPLDGGTFGVVGTITPLVDILARSPSWPRWIEGTSGASGRWSGAFAFLGFGH